jgi:uncharacterized protein involved in oxidation of intracellular sulfur
MEWRKTSAIMSSLIIFNRPPYDSTDVTWNGLRLARKLIEVKEEVKIFLMNDSVDMARDVCKPPAGSLYGGISAVCYYHR